MAGIRQFCEDRNIALIEDCAHAMFGEVDGRPVGAWGDFAIASLTKFFPVTDGGCLVVNSKVAKPRRPERRSIPDEIRSMANSIDLGAEYRRLFGMNAIISGAFGVANSLRGRTVVRNRAESTDAFEAAMPHDWLNDFAATAVASREASKWAQWVAGAVHRDRIVQARRRNYLILAKEIGNIAGVKVLMPQLPEAAAPYVFPIWVDDPSASYQALRKSGVPIFRWDNLWPDMPEIEHDRGRNWATHVFQLGCHQDLSVDDLALMVDRLRRILSNSSRSKA